MLPGGKKRKNIVAKIPIRSFVDLIYTGDIVRSISARTGKLYICIPDNIVRVCDVDVEPLILLGCFTQ